MASEITGSGNSIRSRVITASGSHNVSPVVTSFRPTQAAISPACGFVNFVTVVGLHQHDTPDALFLTLHRVPHRIAFLQRPGVDADKGQLADVGVGHQFERQRRQRLIVARMAFRRLALLINALYRRNIQRRRHQLHHRIEHALHAFVFKGAPQSTARISPSPCAGADRRRSPPRPAHRFPCIYPSAHRWLPPPPRPFSPPLLRRRQRIVEDWPIAKGHATGGVIHRMARIFTSRRRR